MIAEAVGERLEQRRALARARALERAARSVAHRDRVVAVELLAGDPRRDAFLRQRLGGALQPARHRDRVLIVDDQRDKGQLPHAGRIERFVEIALRGRAIAEHGKRDARLISQLHRVGDADGMRQLLGDRHAERKIARRLGKDVAALVPAPVQKHPVRRHSAQAQNSTLAVARQHDILACQHRAYPGVNRLLAKRRGVGAHLPGALHRDRLGVERTHEHHRAILGNQGARVAREIGKSPEHVALRIQVLGVADFEAGNDGHRHPLCCRPSPRGAGLGSSALTGPARKDSPIRRLSYAAWSALVRT